MSVDKRKFTDNRLVHKEALLGADELPLLPLLGSGGLAKAGGVLQATEPLAAVGAINIESVHAAGREADLERLPRPDLRARLEAARLVEAEDLSIVGIADSEAAVAGQVLQVNALVPVAVA